MTFLDIAQFQNSRHDWRESLENTGTFWQRNQQLLAPVQCGATFIPEAYNLENGPSRALAALDFIINTLGMRTLRFGMRWNTLQPKKDIFEFEVYRPLLQYCFDNGVSITLAAGPIKSPGWPEQFVPDWVLSELSSIPAKNTVVEVNSELSHRAHAWISRLTLYISREFSLSELTNITTIQIENELANPFGKWCWVMSDEFALSIVDTIDLYLPGRKILYNSAGRFNLRQLTTLILKHKNPRRCILGLDYYYTNDSTIKHPFHQYFNGNTIGLPWHAMIAQTQLISQKYGFALEVTEAQMEPWGRSQAPGNSIQSLQYIILQSRRFLQICDPWKLYIGLWGIDRFANIFLDGTQTSQHIMMKNTIAQINGLCVDQPNLQ